MKPILKGKKVKTRILRPSEYELLKEGAVKREYKLNLDVLLFTGLRYVEAQRLQQHPEWFDNNFIHLPSVAILKGKRKQIERWIRLTSTAKALLPFFFDNTKLPTLQTWNGNLKRWAKRQDIDTEGLIPKTTRKTWESWLVFFYPQHLPLILLSQGHTTLTCIQHYLNMPFGDQDKSDMRKFVEGWI